MTPPGGTGEREVRDRRERIAKFRQKSQICLPFHLSKVAQKCANERNDGIYYYYAESADRERVVSLWKCKTKTIDKKTKGQSSRHEREDGR